MSPPYGGQQQLHCILIPGDDDSRTYLMKYEYMGTYWPLLAAKGERGRFYKRSYDISLASNGLVRERDANERWADLVSPIRRQSNQQEGRMSWFLNRLRLGHRYMTDAASDNDSNSSQTPLNHDGDSSEEDAIPTSLIARVSGNKLFKRFKYFKNGREFGCINIKTHYIKCQPRDIFLVLHSEGGASLSLQSKKPEWNERFGVFELDFGGRINCDSIKNFQIEYRDKIVSET